jgi:hypothetical protein
MSGEIVIRLISWRISAMINAHDWLEKRVKAIFEKFSATIKCLVIVAHLFGITREKDNVVKMPGYQAELICKLLCATRMPYWERLEEGLHSQMQTHAFLPYIMRKSQKREPNR